MGRLNFSVFVDKVESGQKTQTIRLWDQPSIKKLKVGDRVNLWWTKRGLKKGLYCRKCMVAGIPFMATDASNWGAIGASEPIQAVFGCENCRTRCTDAMLRCVFPKDAPFIELPRLLGTATITEKFKLTMGPVSEEHALADFKEIVRRDGFDSFADFKMFFDKYGCSKKPVEFAVIRWRLWDDLEQLSNASIVFGKKAGYRKIEAKT